MATQHVQALDRLIDLLEAVAEGPSSLTEIARRTRLSTPTAYRLLGGLVAQQLVIRDPESATFRLGPGFLVLAPGSVSGIGAVPSLGRSILDRLAASTGETAALHEQQGDECVVMEAVHHLDTIHYRANSGTRAPLHDGAAGIVLLAFSETQAGRAVVEGQRSTRGATVAHALERRLRDCRRDGFALSIGEHVRDAAAVSVPVRGGRHLLALSILGPRDRLPTPTLMRFLPELHEAARVFGVVLDGGVAIQTESA